MDSVTVFKQRLESISNIPTLPVVLERITRLLQNPQTSAEEIGRVIATDQAIALKVLRLVNSAFYGFPGRISTVTHAIVILGFATVKNIVLTASIFDSFKNRSGLFAGFDLDKFWQHSIACGAASQTIARFIGAPEKEECFVAGLIHDIGKIILCQYFSEDFAKIALKGLEKKCSFIDAERQVIGMSHQEVGGLVVERWRLPTNILNVVKFHHQPGLSQEHFNLVSIVHCADLLVRALEYGNGGDELIPLVNETSWQKLGLSSVVLGDLLLEIDSEVTKAKSLLNLA